MKTGGTTIKSPRIALYSHDTMGLGHVRRNLLVARALAEGPLQAEVLMIAGMREAGAFAMPKGVDCLTLPAYRKEANGSYRARSLHLDSDSLRALRSATIAAALHEFVPDILVVDNVPRGVEGELTPILEALRQDGRTRCVLGLRDVLDDAKTVRRQWWRQRNYEAVRDFYDAVWVYGDADLYDTAREYGFERAIADKIVYTGYLDQAVRLATEAARPACPDRPPYILCAVGGGQDGMMVTEAFVRAELPEGRTGIILTGPFMPESSRQTVGEIAASRPDMEVLDFVAEPIGLMRDAERVVTMGGYNTVMEILSLEKRALVIPRVKPRREQVVRAERLAARGLIDMLEPHEATVERLSQWMATPQQDAPCIHDILDFNGLQRIPRLAQRLIAPARTHPIAVVPALDAAFGGAP